MQLVYTQSIIRSCVFNRESRPLLDQWSCREQWQLEDDSTPKQSSAWLDVQGPSHYPGLGSAQIPKCGHACPEIRALGVLFCFHFVCFQGQPTNSMGSELASDNSKLHGHTNEHVQFEGAHQEINRSLLPCTYRQ